MKKNNSTKKNYMKDYLRLISVCLSFLLIGCVPELRNTEKKMDSSPSTFLSGDTTGYAPLDYSVFFKDPILVSLLDSVIMNNRDLLIAQQKIEFLQSDLIRAKGELLPTLSGGLAYNQRKFGLYTMDGAGNITTDIIPGQIIPIHLQDYYLGFQTSWEVDVWGKLRNKKKSALNKFLSSVEYTNFIKTQLIAETATSYFYLLALDIKSQMLSSALKNQELALEMVQAQKMAAQTNELAVLQFEAQIIATKILLQENFREINQCENRINFLAGRYPQPVLRDTNFFNRSAFSEIQSGIPSDLLSNRPDIRAAEFELIAAGADLKAARAAFFPSFTINGIAGFQAFNLSYLLISPESVMYGLLGSLTAPLINRNAIKADYSAANATQIEAIYSYQKIILEAYVEVNNEWFNLINTEEVVKLKNLEIELYQKSIEISLELFKTGKANYLEVLTVQQGLLETSLELIDAQLNQFYTMINLYRSLGGGWK